MSELIITEVLPEGDDRIWVSLNDGLTRLVSLHPLLALPSHRTLRLRRLVRCPKVSSNGQFICWPGGAYLDVDSVRDAPHGVLPVDLYGVFASPERFRPLAAVLRRMEPNLHGYSDVRPLHTVCTLLALKQGAFESMLQDYRPAPSELLQARLSDLGLFLSAWFPAQAIPALLHRPWPYAIRRYPGSQLLDTAAGCIRHGRIDLVEAPLLLLATEGH
ncbi:DUF2442 domain-containing protein [Deinococcus alpinitundrae]|uniref:DUF2442 domain-containing protein n=1 Tax=Deinococcus alpinitundrae TaxID=468913 RepID=UPI00137AF2C0|nr:DUF2442 domain-containing protein [Deinococcus alpinitundrae]